MSRCERSCDTYEVSISTAGIFASIQPIVPRGALVKIMGSREFVEIVTLGLEVHLSSGECNQMR
jgi:hypothetical protein